LQKGQLEIIQDEGEASKCSYLDMEP